MTDLSPRILSQDKTRALLRKLRDLNLPAGPIAVTSRARVALAGCTSTDVPAENGVRYRTRLADGTDGTLEIQADRKSTRLNSSHTVISYAVFCLKKKKN